VLNERGDFAIDRRFSVAQPMDPQQDNLSECFQTFYRREYRLLLKTVMAAGGTLEEARDAVGETIVEMWRRRAEISNFGAYASKAVLTNFKKQRMRDRNGLERAVKGGHLTLDIQECVELTVWEDKQWVDQLVCSLPPAQREVVEVVLGGLEIDEISELFGRRPATIRRNLERARRRLAESREKRGHEHEGGEIR
jgi:RNA polymerase sigma factor (sigma-70 family)